jgi:hypothetical protein
MTQHNVGALLVVKPSGKDAIAGIVTERGQNAVLGCIFYVQMDTVSAFL